MIRDFSNTTRQRILSFLSDNSLLFAEDINYASLFGCAEATEDDYAPFAADIETYITCANNGTVSAITYMDGIKEEVNKVFDEAQQCDKDYIATIEDDMTLTLENYMSDLKTLVDAIAVGGVGDTQREMLENLGKYDAYNIFDDSSDFKDSLSSVDNLLYEEFISQFVTSSGMNDEAISSFFAENNDDLHLWELQAFESLLLSCVVIDPETGELDEEAFLMELEKFIEACYYYEPYTGAGHEDYYVYHLHDEYAQIFAYYDAHVGNMLDAYPGALNSDSPNWQIYSALSDMDALLEGVYLYGQEIQISSFQEDEVNGGWMDEPVSTDVFDISLTSDNSWMYINYPGSDHGQINVSHFGPLDQSVIAAQYYNQEALLADPDDAYINALQEGVGDYIVSQLTGPLEDLIPEPVQEALDVAEIFTDAEEAREEQEATNQEIHENMNSNAHLLLIGTANGENAEGGIPAHGNVISYDGEDTLTNHQFDEDALATHVNEYNTDNGTSIDPNTIIAAVTDPSCVDFSDPIIEQFLGIAQTQNQDN
ncbi:MAG: hypothetical protein E7257_03485 [Lachnospiraceae bacterium]|nr:hypothetical protein [Lachnospiraceae bacterium]